MKDQFDGKAGERVVFPELVPQYPYELDEVRANMVAMDAQDFPVPASDYFEQTRVVAIIGGGPTLNDDVGGKTRLEALDESDERVIKVVAGSAHRLLDNAAKFADGDEVKGGMLRRGADISIFNAPGPLYADCIDRTHAGTEYWLASQVDPAVTAKLGDVPVRVWDAYVPGVDYDGRERPVVGSGSTAPTAAVALFYTMGVRNFDFYGVDGGSFETLPNEYAAYDLKDVLAKIPDAELEEHVLIEIDGQRMKVATNFWSQLEEMQILQRKCFDARFTFHGETSLNNMVFNQGKHVKILHDPRVKGDEPDADSPKPGQGS